MPWPAPVAQPADPALADAEVAVLLPSAVPFVAEHAMYWPGGEWYEDHASFGSTETGVAWGIGEGHAGGPAGESTFVLIENVTVHRRMKALVMSRPGTLELREVDATTRPGECLVRVGMAGICGTDLQILDGYAEFRGIPGHELVGIVETAPDTHASWIGKRVVSTINIGCNACDWCRQGVREHCVQRTVVGIRDRDGGFAEYLSLPASNLHEVPDSLDDITAVFVEPVAAACRILEQIPVDRARVAVVGDGRMGLIVAQVMRTIAPDVTVFGRHDHKLAVARSLDLLTESSDSTIPYTSRFDIVVDVTGRPAGLPRALEFVRPRGTVVMKSTFHGEAPIQSWPIVVDELTLLGSRCGPFEPAIALLASGAVRVAPLVSRVARIEDYESAFAEARTGLKVLFRM